jgi:predicted phosphohydrolase
VVYVLGNHEFYRNSLPNLTETLKRESEGSHIHVLENDAVEINGYIFLGCTLWTDFRLLGHPEASMQAAAGIMSDYGLIEYTPEHRSLCPRDTARLHKESVEWLRDALARCERQRTIVVTHHAPSVRSQANVHATSPLSPAFASDLGDLVKESGIPLWIHGHTHHNTDYTLGRTRVLTNQRGFPDEPAYGFNSSLIVEV